MNRRTSFLLGSFAIAALSGAALAQTESRPRTGVTAAPSSTPAKRPARTGSIPPSPPAQPIIVNTTGYPLVNTTGVANSTQVTAGQTYGAPVAIAQITYYPTVVLTDGRVLANFGTGRGYEQVLRQCALISGPLPPGVTMSPCWTADGAGRYVVIQQR